MYRPRSLATVKVMNDSMTRSAATIGFDGLGHGRSKRHPP